MLSDVSRTLLSQIFDNFSASAVTLEIFNYNSKSEIFYCYNAFSNYLNFLKNYSSKRKISWFNPKNMEAHLNKRVHSKDFFTQIFMCLLLKNVCVVTSEASKF